MSYNWTRITFYTPLPNPVETAKYDINPSIVSYDITTQLPGGFNSAVIQVKRLPHNNMRFPAFPKPQDIKPRGYFTMKIGQHLLFEGTVLKVKSKGGEVVEVNGLGLGITGMNDDWYKNNEVNVSSTVAQIQATQKSAGDIIRDAISSTAPQIVVGSSDEFQDPGTIFIPGSFYGQTPAQIIEAMTKIGSSLNVVWDYWVYDNRILHFKPRQLVGRPKFWIPEDDDVEWIDDATNMAGEARVEFKLPDWDTLDKGLLVPDHNGSYQTDTLANPTFFRKNGFKRNVYIKAGELTSSIAKQFRDTHLQVHAFPDITATIDRTSTRGMETGSGELPAYVCRASDWVQVADKDPVIVVRTQLNEKGVFKAELGKSAQNWDTIISYLREVSRHVVMGTNPLSGLRS